MTKYGLLLAWVLAAGPTLLGASCGSPPPDTFVIAGQSNAVGSSSLPAASTSSYAEGVRSESYREYPSLGGAWKLANDPLHGSQGNRASAWPWMAHWWHLNRGRGIEFIAAAEPATCLANPQAAWDPASGVLYQRMLDWVESSGVAEQLNAVLWYQGECEATVGVPPATYQAALEGLAGAVVSRMAGVPLIVAPVSLGLAVDGSPSPIMLPIHDAIIAAAAQHPDIWLGPSTDDLALEPDLLHIRAVDVLGARWGETAAAVLDAIP